MGTLTPHGSSFEREQARRIVCMEKELADTQAALQRMTDQCAAEKRRADAAVDDFGRFMDSFEQCDYCKTNGDNIRSMDNEELVFVIPCPRTSCSIARNDRDCYTCKLRWLDSEEAFPTFCGNREREYVRGVD